MDYAALLVGAAIALGSAFLGIVSEAGKSWISRRTSIADKKTAFQHQTAVELQETLYDAVQQTERLYIWYLVKHKDTGVWGDPSLPPEKEGDKLGIPRARVQMLVERLSDDCVRKTVYDLLEIGPLVLGAETVGEATRHYTHLKDQSETVNKILGKVVRESWPM